MTGEHHVLIIEDDSRTAELHTSMLRRDGYEVDVARDGVSRIDLAGSRLPDAVILDVTCPVSVGRPHQPYGLAQFLRSRQRHDSDLERPPRARLDPQQDGPSPSRPSAATIPPTESGQW